MKLYLIRHGETQYNRDGLVQGWVDSNLTETGISQAKKVAEKLNDKKIEIIFCSDLGRAYQTAKIISKKLKTPLLQNWLLRERSLGKLEKTLACEVDWDKYNQHCLELVAQEIEPPSSMVNRAQLFLDSLSLMPKKFETAAVITHGGMLTAFKRCFNPDQEFEEFKNTDVVEIDF
jgi:probable phosphoglycerate mutase